MISSPGEITQLLIELKNGNRAAESKLIPLVYKDLRRLAAGYMRKERPEHSLQPTALVHEAYLRLLQQTKMDWQCRAQFFGIAAETMRRILVDHARAKKAEKRGGSQERVNLDTLQLFAQRPSASILDLDEALQKLEECDPRAAKVVELMFFSGLTEPEIAHLLGISVRTVKRDLSAAKAWLCNKLSQ